MEKKRSLFWLWYVLSAGLVGVDQLVKALIRSHMQVGDKAKLIPHVVELFYVRNSGAAFSLFSDHTWILAVISALASVVLIVLLARGKWFRNGLSRLGLALILGGAVGNLIDRVFMGSVTDMFNFTFMNFGVFNVADMGVTLGAVALIIGLLVQGDEGSEEEKDGTDPADAAS